MYNAEEVGHIPQKCNFIPNSHHSGPFSQSRRIVNILPCRNACLKVEPDLMSSMLLNMFNKYSAFTAFQIGLQSRHADDIVLNLADLGISRWTQQMQIYVPAVGSMWVEQYQVSLSSSLEPPSWCRQWYVLLWIFTQLSTPSCTKSSSPETTIITVMENCVLYLRLAVLNTIL